MLKRANVLSLLDVGLLQWQHRKDSASLKNGSQREDRTGTRSPVDAPAFNMLELAQELM